MTSSAGCELETYDGFAGECAAPYSTQRERRDEPSRGLAPHEPARRTRDAGPCGWRAGSRSSLMRSEDLSMPTIADEKCSRCGQGAPLSSGVYAGDGGERVRWASWTCGHSWSSGPAIVNTKPVPVGTLHKVLAAAGLRRHAPVSAPAR